MSRQAFCIEIAIREDRSDVHGLRLLDQARDAGLAAPARLRTVRGYSLHAEGEDSVRRLIDELLLDPVMNVARCYPADDGPGLAPGWRRLHVVRRVGVMDPTAQSLRRAAAALGLHVDGFRSWSAYLVPADFPEAALVELGERLLANSAIEDVTLDPAHGVPPLAPLPDVESRRVEIPLTTADDAALERVSAEGCLALDLVEMRAVAEHFRAEGREPTDVELETIAQTWSEHCKHKTLTGIVEYEGETIDNLLKETIARATHELARDFCVSVFVDNAGVITFDDEHHLTFKVETHNHPSAIEPYGGAGTGLGGVIRDTMGTGLGARPIASTDVFCFGPPDLDPARVPKGSLAPLRVMKGVVRGVSDYGNRMGIPTVNGAVCFDPRYVANPLVYCGSIGLLPVERLEKHAKPGDLIVVAGGRTGRDGIHGATFSSLELHEESDRVSAGAVQIGNAIQEKMLLDAQMRARDEGLYRCVTDCGAGGLSSAVGEMGEHTGAAVELDRVPLKYHGLTPTEVWISEAQERMVFAVPPEHEARLLEVFAEEDVEATVIGRFDDTGRLTASADGVPVMDLPMEFLHEGLPRQARPARRRERRLADPPGLDEIACADVLLELLGDLDVASKEWVIRQYDHEVRAGSVVKPLVGARADGPSDGSVVAPKPGSRRGFAVGCGINPRLGDVDPYRMALSVIDEALRNIVVLGGDPDHTAILDNFSWGRCDKPENLGDLVEACRGCYDAALAFGTPFISGKDSLNNDYNVDGVSHSIPATLLISALAIVPDVARTCSMDLKGPDHALVAVGLTSAELGGSLLASRRGASGAIVPAVDLARAPEVLRRIHAAIRDGLVLAAHDPSEGGLAVALAEMALAGDVGARLDADTLPAATDVALAHRLFAETPTRVLLEVDPGRLDALRAVLGDVPHAVVGRTHIEPRLVIDADGDAVVDLELSRLRETFLAPLDLDHAGVAG